jgi:hypothetical protein
MKGGAIYLDAMTAIKKGHPAKNAPKYRCKTNVFSVGNAPLRQKRGCTMNNSNPNDCDFQSHEPADEDENQTPHLQVVEKGQIHDLYVSGRFLVLVDDLITAAVLSYVVKWTPCSTDPDGWIYFSYTSKNSNTQTICGNLRISRGDARKAISKLESADLLRAEARWVANACVKRMHIQINREHPEIAAELAEQEKRRAKNKRRKSKYNFRQSKSDFERSVSDSTSSDSAFDLYSNMISTTPSIEKGDGISDSDIELVHQWLRTIDTARTRSDAIAYINKRLIDGEPTTDLAARLQELRSSAEMKLQSNPSSNENSAIVERLALYDQITGGGES